MKISIIISTYNRCLNLSTMLESVLFLEKDNSFDHEIIVVDNNSNDNTRMLVESFILKNNKIRYIFERKQGLSNARNAGIKNAQGEILAFTDDDVLLDKNWLLNIARFHSECDFDALGGKVLPLYPENTPQWIKDCKDVLSGPIVCHDYGGTIQLYNATMLPFIGANMVIKQKVVEEIGWFNSNLGAGKGTMGDDTEYFRRLQKADKKIFYNPNVLLSHPVDKKRMNLRYFAEWNMSFGKYLVLKNNEKEDKKLVFIFGIPRHLFSEVINRSWKMITSITNKRQFVKAWSDLFIRIGMIKAYRSTERELCLK